MVQAQYNPSSTTYILTVHKAKYKASKRALDLVVVVLAQDLKAASAPSLNSIATFAPGPHVTPRRAVKGDVVEPHHRIDEDELLLRQQPARTYVRTSVQAQRLCTWTWTQ